MKTKWKTRILCSSLEDFRERLQVNEAETCLSASMMSGSMKNNACSRTTLWRGGDSLLTNARPRVQRFFGLRRWRLILLKPFPATAADLLTVACYLLLAIATQEVQSKELFLININEYANDQISSSIDENPAIEQSSGVEIAMICSNCSRSWSSQAFCGTLEAKKMLQIGSNWGGLQETRKDRYIHR